MSRLRIPFVLPLLSFVAMVACHPQPDGTAPAIETPLPPPPLPLPLPPPPVVPAPSAAALSAMRGPLLASCAQEPQLRIRIQVNLENIALGHGPTLISTDLAAPPHTFAGPLQVVRQGAGFALTDADGKHWTWAAPNLVARSKQGAMAVGDKTYQGTVELAALDNGRMDLINDLPLEMYLPGVLAKELYDSWHAEAYRAQAITARSYAIWQMTKHRAEGRAFDMEASEASQAYVGVTRNPKANQAVAATRGIVLIYDARILPAFYSSCAGGATQDAAIAFPGRVADLPPLRGQSIGNASALSPQFNWPALKRDKQDAVRRLAAWGAAQKLPIAALGDLRQARVSQVARSGRPAAFELTDEAGHVFSIGGEEFRVALNGGQPPLPANLRLPSSFCTVRVAGGDLVFENGHGYGHGVGLEQWGAEGMAKKGQKAESILEKYYPGAILQKAY